jgi:hypothetical protein
MSEITTIKGLVHKINPTQQVSDKFAKKEIIIKTDGEYPQYILIQFTQKNIDKLDHITAGSTVVVSYNIRGKLWTNPQGEEKCFVTIEGWQIKTENQQSTGEKKEDVKHYSQPDFGATATDSDDLPF